MSNFGNRISGFFSSGGGSGGGGSVNPTSGFIPFNDTNAFADSFWKMDSGAVYTMDTIGGTNIYGFIENKIFLDQAIGDTYNLYGGVYIQVSNDSITPFIRTFNFTQPYGVNIENTKITLGDYNPSGNATYLTIDDFNQQLEPSANLKGNIAGLSPTGDYVKLRFSGDLNDSYIPIYQ